MSAWPLVAITLAAGTGLAFTLVPRAAAGPAMLSAAAASTAAGMLAGFLRRWAICGVALAPGCPCCQCCVCWSRRRWRWAWLAWCPGQGSWRARRHGAGRLVFGAALLAAREFGAKDREKFFKILLARGRDDLRSPRKSILVLVAHVVQARVDARPMLCTISFSTSRSTCSF